MCPGAGEAPREPRPGDEYRPNEYWSARLAREFNLRGTGHISYSERYNAWLYRAKRRALRRGLRGLRPPLDALDVGSGTGWAVPELLRLGTRLEGCDIVEESVRRLGERFPDCTFFRLALGAEPIPRPDSSYDLVIALDVLYHLPSDPEWEAGLAELARVLRSHGRLVVTDGFGDEDRAPAAHVRFRSQRRWRSAASEHGLELAEARPLYRWLSRDPNGGPLARLPDGARGAVEYCLEFLWPREPHMRCAVLVRRASTPLP